MKRFKPTFWLSFGLVSVTLALALTAYLMGLMPDGHRAELESRAKVAESIAVQLANAANRNDDVVLRDTLEAIVERNDDVFSSAFRLADGSIVVSSGDHEKHWVASEDGKSTPTHVTVPLYGAEGLQGAIELSFGPATTGSRLLGIPVTLLLFLLYLMGAGFAGYFFILRRTLHELDPGRVIPERVQKSFDTLSEGVIILDEKERILLVNQSFAAICGKGHEPELGRKINTMSWRMRDGRAQAGGYPWHTAIRENREMREGALSLRTHDGAIHNFNVNATVIADEKDKVIGAIVTLTDMTRTKRDREELEKVSEKLRLVEKEAAQRGRELTYVSRHDVLTGCLNRRAYFQQLTNELERKSDQDKPVATLMVNIDRLQTINEHHGIAAGDQVVAGVAECLKSVAGETGFVGRYSSVEFCITLPGCDEARACELAEKLRNQVSGQSSKLLPGDTSLSISLGIASGTGAAIAAHTHINHCEQALDHAKTAGGNRNVLWREGLDQTQAAQVISASGGAEQKSLPIVQRAQATQSASLPSPSSALVADISEFMAGIDRSLHLSQMRSQPSAVVQISVATWSYLLEALGEAASEDLTRAIKHRFESRLNERHNLISLASTGEFLISVSQIDSREDVARLVNRLLEDVRKPFIVNKQDVYVSCHAGIAMFPDNGGTAAILTRNAGVAMRRAEEEGAADGYSFYNAKMIQESQRRLDIEAGIREALQRDEFELFFQPIVDLKTGALSAAESLLRCTNRRLSSVRIDQIIGIAEQSSLIAEIDMWVLQAALKQMQIWDDTGVSLPKISINISATQFSDIEFMDKVFDAIKSVRFSPSRVQIEVTETSKMADVEVAAPQLKRLQQLGVLIALDDFGTGQASLTYLQRLHPDVVKIDRSFVSNVHANHANATMVSAVTVMAHCLGLKVVVEGVEDEHECEFLRTTGCDEMQGYFISKPMPSAVMSEWMALFVRTNGAAPHLYEYQPLAESEESAQLTSNVASNVA